MTSAQPNQQAISTEIKSKDWIRSPERTIQDLLSVGAGHQRDIEANPSLSLLSLEDPEGYVKLQHTIWRDWIVEWWGLPLRLQAKIVRAVLREIDRRHTPTPQIAKIFHKTIRLRIRLPIQEDVSIHSFEREFLCHRQRKQHQLLHRQEYQAENIALHSDSHIIALFDSDATETVMGVSVAWVANLVKRTILREEKKESEAAYKIVANIFAGRHQREEKGTPQ